MQGKGQTYGRYLCSSMRPSVDALFSQEFCYTPFGLSVWRLAELCVFHLLICEISRLAAQAYFRAKTTCGLVVISTYARLFFHVLIKTQPSRQFKLSLKGGCQNTVPIPSSTGTNYPHYKRHNWPRIRAMTWQHLQAGQEGHFRGVDTGCPCLRLPSLQPAQVTYIHSFYQIHTIRLSIAICWGLSPFPHRLSAHWGNTSLWCRAVNRTRACVTASRRTTNWATPHHNWATPHQITKYQNI